MSDYYKKGEWNAICDRCGFQYKSGRLRKTWDNFMVCKDCWEPRHPLDMQRPVKDDPSVPWTRPDDMTNEESTSGWESIGITVPSGTFDNSL